VAQSCRLDGVGAEVQHSTGGKEKLGHITQQTIATCDGYWSPVR
jgi:hypothetical protein